MKHYKEIEAKRIKDNLISQRTFPGDLVEGEEEKKNGIDILALKLRRNWILSA